MTSTNYPVRIDGSQVRFWALKRDAVAAAKSIGWPANSVWAVATRFCEGYALYSPAGMLSRDEFGRLYHARNDEENQR